jgi:hypothetical protein
MKKNVYLKYEKPNTYIVSTDNQDVRSYKGPVTNYKPCDWDKYTTIQSDSEKQKYKTYDKCEADRKAEADRVADKDVNCLSRAINGECAKNPNYMNNNCITSCNVIKQLKSPIKKIGGWGR